MSPDDLTSQTPARANRDLTTVLKYGSGTPLTIGAVLSCGRTRNPDWRFLNNRGHELPWGELPVLGFGFIISGLVLLALTHPASQLFAGK